MIRKNFLILIALLSVSFLSAQECASGSFGNAYIPSGSFMSIFGDHTFVNDGSGFIPGIIQTDRGVDRGEPGFVNFTASSTWSGASDAAHVNGFVRTFSTGPFVFPVGNGERLRMLGISGSANATAAFFDEDPAITTGVMDITNPDLEAVSDREFWILTGGAETTVTLTWDQLTNIEDLVTGDINRLTIIGWNGSSWDIIPTTVNASALANNSSNVLDDAISTSFSVGSASSDNVIVPSDFEIITFGSLAVPRTGIIEDGELSIFPNPARIGENTFVEYDLKGTSGKMEIYDGYQRLVFEQILESESGVVNLPQFNLTDDKYVVTLIEKDGSKTSKILILIK